MSDRQTEEAVGPQYDTANMLEARQRTWHAIERIAAAIRPGMRESEGVKCAKSILKDLGLLRGWHAVYVRFGENTLATYWDKDAPDVVLSDNDIFYIDIGPVWERWEGDGGNTFVLGDDPEMLAAPVAAHEIFDRVQAKWRADAISGTELYRYAEEVAASIGWQLAPDVLGHRLADFPHKVFHSGTLAEIPYTPSTDLWVLEIQIRHPTRRFGAFFEDLLLEQTPQIERQGRASPKILGGD